MSEAILVAIQIMADITAVTEAFYKAGRALATAFAAGITPHLSVQMRAAMLTPAEFERLYRRQRARKQRRDRRR